MKFKTVKELIIWLCGVGDITEKWWDEETNWIYVQFEGECANIFEETTEDCAYDVIYGTFGTDESYIGLNARNNWTVRVQTEEALKFSAFYKLHITDLI